MIQTHRRGALSLALDVLVIVAELAGLYLCAGKFTSNLLVYYTEDSNILALLACIISAVSSLLRRKSDGKLQPKWVQLLKYAAVSVTTVTMMVVLFVLIPMSGRDSARMLLFDGSSLYVHTLCPLLMLVNFILCDTGRPLPFRSTFAALIPTLVYAAVSIPLNILRVWTGPYPFLRVYQQPVFMSVVWFIVIVGGAFGIALVIRLLHKALRKHNI